MLRRNKRRKIENTAVKVLCRECHDWFMTPSQCLQVSNWNVCLTCLAKEGKEIRARLKERGITLPGEVTG
jgi:hypothetical protein